MNNHLGTRGPACVSCDRQSAGNGAQHTLHGGGGMKPDRLRESSWLSQVQCQGGCQANKESVRLK